jgi:hypothetical protein
MCRVSLACEMSGIEVAYVHKAKQSSPRHLTSVALMQGIISST